MHRSSERMAPSKVTVSADLQRKPHALTRLNHELEQRVAELTRELEATTEALREALREADRRKDEFIAVLAHELRNPLAPIRTAVQLLRQGDLPEPHRGRARDIIERQVEHLVRLIDDLMDVSRITRGTITLVREPVSLSAVVAEAVDVARARVTAKQHELTVSLPDEDLVVDGDSTRMVQIVGNVLQNAVKFTEPGGRVALSLRRDDNEAVVTVADSGTGISAHLLPSVFELFVQSDHGQGGLGIGLALVRRLAELHQGRVEVVSEGPGCGTTVTLRLPVTHGTVDSPRSGPAEVTVSPTSLRVLVADDNHDAAAALQMHLRLLGHDVQVAHDGLEALAAGEAFMPELVLLDLGMPRLNGYDTAREMRRRPWGSEATLVALTGWGQPEDRRDTADAGFDLHLVKPVGELRLAQLLAERGAASARGTLLRRRAGERRNHGEAVRE
ncbi:MAG: ATP-binding protein [Vicinamibacterales bacterium]